MSKEMYSNSDMEPKSLEQRLIDSAEHYQDCMDILYHSDLYFESRPEDKIGAHSKTHFRACYYGDAKFIYPELPQPAPKMPDPSGDMFEQWSRLLIWTREALAWLRESKTKDIGWLRFTKKMAWYGEKSISLSPQQEAFLRKLNTAKGKSVKLLDMCRGNPRRLSQLRIEVNVIFGKAKFPFEVENAGTHSYKLIHKE